MTRTRTSSRSVYSRVSRRLECWTPWRLSWDTRWSRSCWRRRNPMLLHWKQKTISLRCGSYEGDYFQALSLSTSRRVIWRIPTASSCQRVVMQIRLSRDSRFSISFSRPRCLIVRRWACSSWSSTNIYQQRRPCHNLTVQRKQNTPMQFSISSNGWMSSTISSEKGSST